MTEQIEKSEQIQSQDIFTMNNLSETNKCSFFGVTLNNEFDNIFQNYLSNEIGSSNQTVSDSAKLTPSKFPKDRPLISFLLTKVMKFKSS